MTPARLEIIEEIFYSAVDRSPDQLEAFLTTACGGDKTLRSEVEVLLACHPHVGNFIETPVLSLATALLEKTESLVGQKIAHYELQERIGAGGMGEVYLAQDVVAGRKAALKLLPLLFTNEPERLRRFEREAHAVVALNHPNIVTVYEIGEDRGTHYIASELIAGETLRQRLKHGAAPLHEAVEISLQLASALSAAHEAGIVHRDIKPENIMLRPDGYVKVLDFGIAKLAEEEMPDLIAKEEEALGLAETRLGLILGTVRYMAPEQVLGGPIDGRSDIWSLGVVLYEMVAGRAPFDGETPRAVMKAIVATEPPSLANATAPIPEGLRQIISRTLRKESGERYQNARELIDALKTVRRRMDLGTEAERPHSWLGWPRLAAAALVVAVAAVSFFWYRNLNTSAQPEKSIAVLPFEDLSNENSDFAAGVQDDVLTSLGQVHDLKVISRTSVMAYQEPDGRNMRAIGRALGVANVLEGSVRRAGNRVLVNVQLIDARNDRHLWAERYDRTVADSIGLQGELATQIAATLKAKLAPQEKARLGTRPTTNSEAYVLYLTALGTQDEIAAEQLFIQATAIDPGFAPAYAQASILNSRISGSITGDHRVPTAKARAQAEEAVRLSPTLGEAHMALGLCLYWGDKKYDAALKEFEVAAAISPNNAEIYTYVGGIYRRQGRWREAVASFERALSLDPRNARIAFRSAMNHTFIRDWPAAAGAYKRGLEIAPDDPDPKVGLAYLEVFRNGNPAAGRKILENIPAASDVNGLLAAARWDLAMLERDYAAAEKVLIDSPLGDFPSAGDAPKTFYQGRIALAHGDVESAQRYFAAARPAFEGWVRDDPDDPDHHARLGLLYAYMQRKEDAIREARRAIELEPESENAFHGAQHAAYLALVSALVGEPDQAITLIERLLSTPGAASYPDFPNSITLAELRLRWEWDSLRSNPRFQKILAGPEPSTILQAGR